MEGNQQAGKEELFWGWAEATKENPGQAKSKTAKDCFCLLTQEPTSPILSCSSDQNPYVFGKE